MNKEEYLEIRNNPKADTLPVLYFFYQLQGGTGLPTIKHFSEAFGLWMIRHGHLPMLGQIIYYVETKLNKHFNV